jgi:hypothetical protein
LSYERIDVSERVKSTIALSDPERSLVRIVEVLEQAGVKLVQASVVMATDRACEKLARRQIGSARRAVSANT